MKEFRLHLYDYHHWLGTVTLFLAHIPKAGECIEVNFDDLFTLFEAGAWERPSGLFTFPIHFIENGEGEYQAAIDQVFKEGVTCPDDPTAK